ncbi:MAG: hypothetical protein ACLPY3_23795, partial [Solirubrobacteraceae bacterium]
SGSIVAAARRATVRVRRLIECPSLREQHPEPERTIGIATLIGAAVCRLGLGQRPLLFEQSTEVRGGTAMATLVGATVCRLGLGQPPLLFEQSAEVRGGSAPMVTRIGVTIGRLCFNHAPLASELLTEVESASDLGRLGEIVRWSPRPAVCAIADASRTGFGAMSVGVNLVGVGYGEGFVPAI